VDSAALTCTDWLDHGVPLDFDRNNEILERLSAATGLPITPRQPALQSLKQFFKDAWK
jgi:hypothetical protein